MGIKHETAVVHSALWAAAGDALGWMTELGREGTVVARTGQRRVTEPVQWRRRIGGRGGVEILLPAGTYSDDTQLRLAVCRSMRASGDFDAEAFARIELTVWPSYALGAGRGSKAAAANLTKRGVNWFSNFFVTKDQNYLRAGGNGAAMRIQPHVWSNPHNIERLVLSVMRDSLSTHGHTHGFCGAVFHALCLHYTLVEGSIPGIDIWREFVGLLRNLPATLHTDGQLSTFWVPAWSKASDKPLHAAVEEFVDEALGDLIDIGPLLQQGPDSYTKILERLGCFTDRYRGSGWKTALAGAVLAWLGRDEPVEVPLQAAANALGSDTDTIATMAGALLGAIANGPPKFALQDRDYLVLEARRMAALASGMDVQPFGYPDLSQWQAPSSQSDAVLAYKGGLALAGLGKAQVASETYLAGDFVWQWLKLPFGQTVLAKRRIGNLRELGDEQLPRINVSLKSPPMSANLELPLQADGPRSRAAVNRNGNGNGNGGHQSVTTGPKELPSGRDRLDRWTDEVIRSDFDDRVLGELLNRYIDQECSTEAAASFAAIVAKAKLSRKRREARG